MLKKKSGSQATRKTTSKYSDIVDKIKPVANLGLVIAALFYGRAGTGKTTLSSTFPGPILHLDIREKGTDSIADVKDVDSLQIQEWDEFEQVYWYLKSGSSKYKTVVVDAVTQLQDAAVEKTVSEGGRSDGMVSKQQWGKAAGLLKTWLMNYRDLVDEEINVVFLAHDRTHEGEDSEDGEMIPSVGPRLMPSVASILTASVKIIGNTFIKEEVIKGKTPGKITRKVTYCMRIGPHSFYETKIRQPKGSYTPDIIEDPDYDTLVSLMKGEFKSPEPKEPVTRKLLKKGK